MTDAIPIEDQIIEAQLHAMGLKHTLQQLTLNKRATPASIDRVRDRIEVAEAIVETLIATEDS